MRWNERIRLVIGVFNRSAVAVLGAAAVGAAFRPPAEAAGAGAALAGLPLTSLGCALALHLLAHVLVGLIEPEDG
jgi:predicted phage tail protein